MEALPTNYKSPRGNQNDMVYLGSRCDANSLFSSLALVKQASFSFALKSSDKNLDTLFKEIMEASRGQGGIQQLLAAEQEAQHIVNAARNAKMTRLKQAKEEAEKEIAEHRAQAEEEFQRKVAESSGDSGANVKRLEQETEAKIHHLNLEAARISDDVVQMLLKHVTTVKN
ncbi:PREDICTED: V-type proton ATPase subunit G [Theobroma cacao]|uniref:V-type proton ATPase subunit G n=1 Tax=Theobroma cacao TaxID=3641 RepID=A0AB32V2D6_THECC|nr:PREDICTED: V-type proton ATPase subunit G [Theobroma cacao]